MTWICVGRLLTGFATGSFSVIVPLYTSEIAEKEIRGTLGTYFQLQVTGGILFTYVVGSYVSLSGKIFFGSRDILVTSVFIFYLQFNVFGLTVICALVPVAYACLMVLIPESPAFHLMKGKVEKARLSLRYFRGPYGGVDQELSIMQDSLAKVYSIVNLPIHDFISICMYKHYTVY